MPHQHDIAMMNNMHTGPLKPIKGLTYFGNALSRLFQRCLKLPAKEMLQGIGNQSENHTERLLQLPAQYERRTYPRNRHLLYIFRDDILGVLFLYQFEVFQRFFELLNEKGTPLVMLRMKSSSSFVPKRFDIMIRLSRFESRFRLTWQ
jgi:hypothetical protein